MPVIGLMSVRRFAWHPCSTSAQIFMYWLLFRGVVMTTIDGMWCARDREEDDEEEAVSGVGEAKGLGGMKVGVLGEFAALALLRKLGGAIGAVGEMGYSMYSLILEITSGS